MKCPEHLNIRSYEGFTLVEILLAMLITSILVLGVNAAYRQAYAIWSRAENLRPAYQSVRLVSETLRQELGGLYMPQIDKNQGRAFELLYLPDETVELAFYTLTPSWRGSLGSSLAAKVRYRFDRAENGEEAVFERFEQPCAGQTAIGAVTSDRITAGLSDFAVWIKDPNASGDQDSWQQSYESNNTAPRAVKVRLKWQANENTPGIDLEFYSLVPCEGSLP